MYFQVNRELPSITRRGPATLVAIVIFFFVTPLNAFPVDPARIFARHQSPKPGTFEVTATVWQGGARYLDVIIHQTEGFNGQITLTAEDLPPGLHFAPTTIFKIRFPT